MCGNPFKSPKPIASAAPPAPPAPPVRRAPRAPALSEDAEKAENERANSRARRVGRSALRIDLQTTPSERSGGLQPPRG